MNTVESLTELFRQFPGIGPRQAKRFVYFLLTRNNGYASELSKLILEIKKSVNVCNACYRFYTKDSGESNLCRTCSDTGRDKTSLMLVAYDIDFENIEKTKYFNGYYFVLGGTIPILEKNPENKIRQKELIEAINKRLKEGLKEIIIALNYNPEGENTLTYLKNLLSKFEQEDKITISTLGRGLSTGTELEYSDSDTIKNALQNRK